MATEEKKEDKTKKEIKILTKSLKAERDKGKQLNKELAELEGNLKTIEEKKKNMEEKSKALIEKGQELRMVVQEKRTAIDNLVHAKQSGTKDNSREKMLEQQILKIQDENDTARKKIEQMQEEIEQTLSDQNEYQHQNKITLAGLEARKEDIENDYKLLKKAHEDELNIKNKEIEELAKKEEGLLLELKKIQEKKEEEAKKASENNKQVELAETKVQQLQDEIGKKSKKYRRIKRIIAQTRTRKFWFCIEVN